MQGWAVRLASAEADTESVPFRFGVWYDSLPAIAIGHLLNSTTIHALVLPGADSLLSLYTLTPTHRWRRVASYPGPFAFVDRTGFEDLNGDGQREIILASGPNMNGNQQLEIYSYAAATDNLHAAGSMWGVYEVDTTRRRLNLYQWGLMK